MTVRVLIVGDDPLARGGVAALLAGREDVAIAGQVGPESVAPQDSGAAADAIAWDAGPSGVAPGERFRDAGAPVVALVQAEADAAAALRAGARGVLLRGAGGEALAAALVAVSRGLVAFDGELRDALLRAAPPVRAGEALTPREREVLALLSEGLSNKGIAARLGISDHTAKFHVNAILGKLGAETRAEAIVLAARSGLVVL
ncbi:MAG TPA: response regulator transcription factor [Anaeromyxobacteraceae bacterium]|nr:response regulator transcription factor [Anaeromyxobacteraceae bacterium]